MPEKCFHFISQSLLTAHLPGRGPRTTWWKESRYRTTTDSGEEHLSRLLVPLQLCSPAAWLCLAFLFLTHPRNLSGLVRSNRSWATPGLRQVTDYPDLCHLLSLGAKAKGLCWETAQLLLCAGLLVHLEFPMSFLATVLKLPGKLL